MRKVGKIGHKTRRWPFLWTVGILICGSRIMVQQQSIGHNLFMRDSGLLSLARYVCAVK
jgi:hypothetical protein